MTKWKWFIRLTDQPWFINVADGLMLLLAAMTILLFFLAARANVSSAQQPLPPLDPSPYDARMIEIERESIDAAFRDQIVHLYETWMKDNTGQPERAVKGALQARRAYIASMRRIEQREEELKKTGGRP